MDVRLATFLRTFFLATTVLVTDLCIDKHEDNEGRRQEVMEASGLATNLERMSDLDGMWQSFMDLGDSDIVTNWDDLFSALDAKTL
ncbi:hypothetical protein APSETT444_007031 [Aspergillus pseudonomiae]